ncbi:MAG TPA: PIN domain-containing protein [Thermoanaerobaculia bacterium]|nr:PIN domain-containing protein [Thermoanaerobaculia bacterium]
MPRPKIRVFLDTSVLLQYLRGKRELEKLFTPEIEEKVEFVVNGIVLQEVLLSGLVRKAPKKMDLVMEHVTVDRASLLSPVIRKHLDEFRARRAHVNDLMIFDGTRQCDRLLTYDERRQELGQIVEVESETPEELFEELQLAS